MSTHAEANPVNLQIEAQTVASQALQASMYQLAKDVRKPELLDPASPAEEMMERSAALETSFIQLQVLDRFLLQC